MRSIGTGIVAGVVVAVATMVAGVAPAGAGGAAAKQGASRPVEAARRFGQYYSGPPCPFTRVDRTWSQFQVNLGEQLVLLPGRLTASTDGGVMLQAEDSRTVELLTNASRADWLLDYPLLDDEVGVYGHPILGEGCTESEGSIYIESLFPFTLFENAITSRLDLMGRGDSMELQDAVRRYRWALSRHDPEHRAEVEPARAGGAAEHMQEALFERNAAVDRMPWRVRLMGAEDPLPELGTIDVLLSGGDGSVGIFGHISVAANGVAYNIYPLGSERGAPDFVPLYDYFFNAQRGMALRRPNWILRLQGLPPDTIAKFDEVMRVQVEQIKEGRVPYHPTQNNCTVASLKGLSTLGFELSKARYFSWRFPRPAFSVILDELPELIGSGRVPACRVELIYVPQVPTRPSEGAAPNRPIRDRSKVG
ncbi:MAG TPA: hypothetical protein VJV75_03325 [Candidatus Polarisedimenticolia bacterium]|nr:hypothetical protein [Candidatus Polarisedimenticolia bacterium]